MNDETINDVITQAMRQVAPEADLQGVDRTARLQEELDLDSMDFLNFVIGLHERTGIEIAESDYASLATLDGCVEFLKRASSTSSR